MLKLFDNPLVRQYFVVLTVNLNLLATGLHIAWTSPVLVYLSSSEQSVLPEPISPSDGAWLVSIGAISSIVANVVFIAPLVDLIGRKYSLIVLLMPPKLVGCFLYLFASQVWMLLTGRFLMFIGDAAVFSIVPMYASEVASTEIRGSIGTILHFMCSLGVVMMFSVGPFISYVSLNIMLTVITAACIVPLFFLPESPYFSYAKGKKEESRKALIFLRVSETIAEEEIQEYQKAAEKDNNQVNKLDIVKNRVFQKALVQVLFLTIASALVGYNAVQYYLQTILESTATSVRDEYASMIVGMIQLAGSICAALITDSFGRKPILITTSIGMGLGLFGLGLFFLLKDGGASSNFLNYLPLISLVLFVFSNSSGVGALIWVVLSELFDDKSRGLGMASALLTGNVFGFLTTRYFAQITLAIGPTITYWIFSMNSAILALFVLFVIPETKGKTFAQIQDILANKKVSKKPVEGKEDC